MCILNKHLKVHITIFYIQCSIKQLKGLFSGVCARILLIFAKHLIAISKKKNQRTIGPENAHQKPDLGVLSHHEMTLTLNTHKPLILTL